MNNKKNEIRIDVTDWVEDAQRNEMLVQQLDEIGELIAKGISTRKIAEAIISSRLVEIAPEDIIASNKDLLSDGGVMQVISFMNRKRKKNRKNGHLIPEFLGTGKMGTGGENAYGRVDNEERAKIALSYIYGHAMGMIRNRLEQLSEYGMDIEEIGDEIKRRVDDMIEEILTPVEESVPEPQST